MVRKFTPVVVVVGLAALTAVVARVGIAAPDPADLVLLNGKVITLESAIPEAQAVAIVGSRIAAVGSSASMKRRVGPKTAEGRK